MKGIVRKLARVLAAKVMPEIAYPVLKGPLKGFKIIHGAMDGPGKGASVYFNLIEQKQTNEFLRQVKKGYVVFDVGANVGYYTILASKRVGENGLVFSFEPVVRNLAFLYKHIKLNKLKNVVILPCACAEQSTLRMFSFGPSVAQGHIANDSAIKNFDPISNTFVQTITIDEFVHRSAILPKIIKIDVEGSEFLALNGARDTLKKCKPILFLSIHSNELDISCKEYLKKFSYQFILLDEKEGPSLEYLCY